MLQQDETVGSRWQGGLVHDTEALRRKSSGGRHVHNAHGLKLGGRRASGGKPSSQDFNTPADPGTSLRSDRARVHRAPKSHSESDREASLHPAFDTERKVS